MMSGDGMLATGSADWRGKIGSGAAYVTHSFAAVIIGSFSFITALSWNAAIQNTIQERFPTPRDGAKKAAYSVYYAVGITLLTLVLLYLSSKMNRGKGLHVPMENFYMGAPA